METTKAFASTTLSNEWSHAATKHKPYLDKNEFLLTWIWRYLLVDIPSLQTLHAVRSGD